jgi:hypothetical protein
MAPSKSMKSRHFDDSQVPCRGPSLFRNLQPDRPRLGESGAISAKGVVVAAVAAAAA